MKRVDSYQRCLLQKIHVARIFCDVISMVEGRCVIYIENVLRKKGKRAIIFLNVIF